eukprot:scaffold22820_cov61-Phaeocystis_antarctica.AAC.5
MGGTSRTLSPIPLKVEAGASPPGCPGPAARSTSRPLLIAATTRLRPPDVRSANEESVAQVDGSSASAATS